jgi:hypothetical protein
VRWSPAWKLVSWSNDLLVRQSPGSKDVSTEGEEATAFEAVTRREPVKIERPEKTSCVL